MRAARPEIPNRTALLLLVVAGGLFACRPPPFPEPDPDEELLPVSCDDDVLLGLTRTIANSALAHPPWIQVCTLCPVDSLSLTLVDGDANVLATQNAWADGGHCAIAMPREPLPQESELSVLVQLSSNERSATWSFAAEPQAAPTTPPLELGSGTYLAENGLSSLRLPTVSDEMEPQLPALVAADLLLSISQPNKDGSRSIRIGRGEEGIQDLCALTSELSDAGLSEAGEVWGSLDQGSDFPTPFGGLLRRGSLRAQLSEDGSTLQELAVLAVIDLAMMEPLTGLNPDQACLQWREQLGSDPCVPCADPSEGNEGPAHCITTLSEWTSAPQVQARLQPVSSESLSSDCPTP